MILSGPARARTWTWSKISGERPENSSDAPHPTWQSWRGSAEKNGINSPNTNVSSLQRRTQEDSRL
jgi:hypothetical protein